MYCSVLVNCELYSVLPLNLVLESTHCLIDDGTSRDCNAYLKSITSLSQCIVDVKFKFIFMNTGIACVATICIAHRATQHHHKGIKEICFKESS